MRVRGSVWQNISKKKGFTTSVGSYAYTINGGQSGTLIRAKIKDESDRRFVLTSIRSGKTRVYESPAAAIRDGWFIVKQGK